MESADPAALIINSSCCLQFQPLNSIVEPSFWHTLANTKLTLFKLDTTTVPIRGYLTPGRSITSLTQNNALVPLPASISLNSTSLNHPTFNAPPIATTVSGVLKNTNTLHEFKTLDKNALFNQVVVSIYADIQSGSALTNPTRLLRFLLVTFADIKKHTFLYWFAFPAITFKYNVHVASRSLLSDAYPADALSSLSLIFNQHSNEFAFLAILNGCVFEYAALAQLPRFVQDNKHITVVFNDPSALPENPGWPLRNLLLCLAHYGVSDCDVIGARNDLVVSDSHKLSVQWTLKLGALNPSHAVPATGWERLNNGKLGPRSIDLSEMMDPKKLALSAVHLNLGLMKWRVLPDLDLDRISSAKCLLLGAGTLGCYVARGLLAWGVQQIDFVDYGKVSYSNPVRQPLFTFEDCLNGGRDKAKAASERAIQILPTLVSEGYCLSIPMPGHPILNEATFQETFIHLETLIKAHDVVFLLMDSRESRWLPTLIGKLHDKIVINAALGFESYVVMRHADQLGCYYCNDVVAPADSLSNRTLDQMCTVTRPGVAPIAGALAVELMASILNHKETNHAGTNSPGVLGKIPHQIRGFLGSHETILISGQAYNKCTACSEAVITAYKSRGADFVRDVCNNPAILEELTGLDDLHKAVDDLNIGSWADEDEDGTGIV